MDRRSKKCLTMRGDLRFPKNEISGKLHKCISVFRNADSYNRQPLLCQLCGFCMCRWVVCDPRDDGSRKPCIVSGLRQAECDAGQSVYNAGQFPAGSIVRSREDFRYDGRRTGVGRGNCHTVQSSEKRRWLIWRNAEREVENGHGKIRRMGQWSRFVEMYAFMR